MSSLAIFGLISFPLYVVLGLIYAWKPERDLFVGVGFVIASSVFYALDETDISNGLGIPALFFLGSGILMTLVHQSRHPRDRQSNQ
jgi:hypothetical protein